MGFKRLFINNKAIFPVIGVILMVAMTIIPAAAIGSSVFGQGTAQSVPKANHDSQAAVLANVAASGSPTSYTVLEKYKHFLDKPIKIQETAQSTPRAYLYIRADDTFIAAVDEIPGRLASVKVEHLGGDTINFEDTSTKITVSVNGSDSDILQPSTVNTSLGVLSVGDIKTLKLKGMTTGGPTTTIRPGSTVNIKFINIKTNQLIDERDVRF